MQISIRKFSEQDVPKKVQWINDPRNNRYLHYDLPLEEEKTRQWFFKNRDRTDRYDAVIEMDGEPVGVIGLLSIDHTNRKAEYYITLGEEKALGKGVAAQATRLLLQYAFETLHLSKVYLYTETENHSAQRLFERVGFRREGMLKNDLFSRGRFVDRYVYGLTSTQYSGKQTPSRNGTPIQSLGEWHGNQLFVKRDDLLPFSFGGNKTRKAFLFFQEIDRGDYDTVVTYGSGSSNHCRVVANMAAQRGMPCRIIAPLEASKETFNSAMMHLFGAEITLCPVEEVSETIEKTLDDLRAKGRKPYFIPGGGHGNPGTQAYVDCYEEITDYEKATGIHFDSIFLASGTGTTQAGLVCGGLLHHDDRKIIGISIARRNPRGRQVVIDSVKDYLKAVSVEAEAVEEHVIFLDDYVLSGYGSYNEEISDTIRRVMRKSGIALNATYTGKAFWGMEQHLKRSGIQDANILFIHTGGDPLYFDWLRSENP